MNTLMIEEVPIERPARAARLLELRTIRHVIDSALNIEGALSCWFAS